MSKMLVVVARDASGKVSVKDDAGDGAVGTGPGMMTGALIGMALFLLVTALAVDAAAQSGQKEPDTFLKQHVGFKAPDLKAVHAGAVVAKVLDTDEESEIAVFGIVRVKTDRPTFIDRAKRVSTYKSNNVTGIGEINDPPALSDFAQLALPDGDVESIRKCRPGSCDVKATDEAMARIASEMNWKAPNPAQQLNDIVRGMMQGYMAAYMKGGNQALGVYHDKKKPLAAAKVFEGVLQESPYLLDYAAPLLRYLREYPAYRLEGATDLFFWAEESFGLKPTITLNHAVIYAPSDGDDGFVAVKQLYASHYFRGTVKLGALIREKGPGASNAYYFVRLDRARADGLGGMFGGVKRGKIEGKLGGHLEAGLATARQSFEQ